MTDNQRRLLDYIQHFMAENKGRAPSYDEMREAMLLNSKSGIHRMMMALIERGHIVAAPGRGRARAIAVA